MKDLKRISILSGVAYLFIFITGIYANFVLLENLVDSNNPGVTISNLIEERNSFKMAILGFTIMLFFDLVLVWGLYKLFFKVDQVYARLASVLRFTNVLVFGIALYQLIKVYVLLSEHETTFIMTNTFLVNRVLILINDFNYIWLIGLLFFGIHLVVLGYLIWKSAVVPKWLGVLLLFAALGYVVDSIAQLFLQNYSDYEFIFSASVILPGVIGELALTFWLLFRSYSFRKYYTLV